MSVNKNVTVPLGGTGFLIYQRTFDVTSRQPLAGVFVIAHERERNVSLCCFSSLFEEIAAACAGKRETYLSEIPRL
jgi:hypothetical protein